MFSSLVASATARVRRYNWLTGNYFRPSYFPRLVDKWRAVVVLKQMARAKAYPPDIRCQDYFMELEAEAILLGRGLWEK